MTLQSLARQRLNGCSISLLNIRKFKMKAEEKCLCGYDDQEKRIVCGRHFDIVDLERKRLLIEVNELRAEVQRLSQIARY